MLIKNMIKIEAMLDLVGKSYDFLHVFDLFLIIYAFIPVGNRHLGQNGLVSKTACNVSRFKIFRVVCMQIRA